jgi:hypothetical protein
MSKQSEFQRGFSVGKEYIKEHGYLRAFNDWEEKNQCDDYDHGFKRALDEYAQEQIHARDEKADGHSDHDNRADD